MPHNLPLTIIGAALLWVGWFGFNGGSVLSADPGLVSLVLVTTSTAAAAGGLAAAITSWIILFPENEGQMAAFGFLQHNFFILFNAIIVLMFLPRANKDLFGTK